MQVTSGGRGSLWRSALALVLGLGMMIGLPAAMASVPGPGRAPTAVVVGLENGGAPIAVTVPVNVP